jgi:hypothetical protein
MTGEHDTAEEATAWAAVLVAWEDEAAHRAYLSRCLDLEALARAGGRYREVLAARPGDPAAARWRDEVIRRATVAGLASIPREAPAVPRLPRWVRPAFLALLGVVVIGLAVALFRVLSSWSPERP